MPIPRKKQHDMLPYKSNNRSLGIFVLLVFIGVMIATNSVSYSQELQDSQLSDAPEHSVRLDYVAPEKQRWQVGVKVTTSSGSCKHVFATFPVPTDWPEQSVVLAEKELSRYVSAWEVRDLTGGAKQVVLQMANIPPATQSDALFTFEVTKSRITGGDDNTDLVIPKSLDRDARIYLGSSPYIDPRHGKIRKIVTELDSDAPESAWQQVEQIYDWVRDNVEYQEGKIKSAVDAINDGVGDCEELTSLFVALCRARRIPARMVWVPGHCYPEFMLQDADGNATWFPCQAAGTRQFGEMDEYKPILQKGDRFKVPEKKALQRYVAEYCKINATQKPQVTFVRELIDAN